MSIVDPIVAGAPAAGTLLAKRFVLLREIGRGGHSMVYAARDTEQGDEVAVKFLVPPPGRADEARQRLRREVRLLRDLRHPNIVPIRDYIEVGGAAFVVMELIDGLDLARWLRRHGTLGIEATIRLATDLLSALGAAHRARVLHRDVKPGNVLLDLGGRAHLADFGSARREGHATLTATGGLAGTLIYAAPEILAGQRGDARSDLYALGMTLFESLTGRLPEHPRHLPPPPLPGGHHPNAVDGAVPEWLDRLVARATAAAPTDRYPTADAMARDVERREVERVAQPAGRTAHRCLVCEGPVIPGSPLCRSCDTRPVGGMQHVFVRTAGPRFSSAVGELLSADPALVDTGTLSDAAAGRRALMGVPFAGAEGLRGWLSDREVAVEVRGPAAVWSAMPVGYLAVVLGGLVLGTVAGLVASPWFLIASPLVATLLVSAAVREIRRPAIVVGSPPAETDIVPATATTQLRELTPGPARDLLAEVLRLTRELVAREDPGSQRDRRHDELAPIAEAASRAARELEATDLTLDRLRNEAERHDRLPETWWNTVGRTEDIRDRLAQSLLELVAELGSANSGGALTFTAPLAGLEDLTHEFAAAMRGPVAATGSA